MALQQRQLAMVGAKQVAMGDPEAVTSSRAGKGPGGVEVIAGGLGLVIVC